MKKKLMFTLMALAASLCVFGAENAAPAKEKTEKWTPFQIVFLPGFPSSASTSNIWGLKLGIPATGGSGSIRGVEASFLYSGTSFGVETSNVRGVQASWFGPSISSSLTGVQATMSYAYASELIGFQASALGFLEKPSSGCQAGLGAVAKSDFNGFQTGAAVVTVGKMYGFQFSAFNYAGELDGCQVGATGIAKNASGVQCNLVNIVSEICDAFQIGVVNVSSGKKGCFQFGAVNVMSDGFIPVMILFNFSI